MCPRRTSTRSRRFKWKSRSHVKRSRSLSEEKYRRLGWWFNSRSRRSWSRLQRPSSRWCRWKCSRWSSLKSYRQLRLSRSRPTWSLSRRSSSAAETTEPARSLGACRDTPLRETGKWTTPTMRQPDRNWLNEKERAEQVRERNEN